MTAELVGWQDEHSLDHRRRMRNAMLVSLAIHGLVIALFAAAPGIQLAPLPEVLAVELVAAAPSAAPRAKPAPAPPKAPAPAPAPPEPPPEPAAPVAKAPVQVLPEESPGRITKVEPAPPEPKVVAKKKPEPKPVPQRPKREKELSYEDAMAALDDELGVDETADLLTPAADSAESEDSNAEAPADDRQARPGTAISPELARWNLDVRRRIQSKWVMLPAYRDSGLTTSLELNVAASGELIGEPTVHRSSGDPFFDDNAVRALVKAAPLPPVAEPGRRIFIFQSEAN